MHFVCAQRVASSMVEQLPFKEMIPGSSPGRPTRKMKLAKHASSFIRLYFTGFSMGSADIVPGVSGGTLAFILGIYEELIFSIKRLSGETLKLVLQAKFMQAFKSIPFSFLVPLGAGILSAIVVLSGVLSHLLTNQPIMVWSFFFGLIIASILVVRKRVVTWDLKDYSWLVVAAIFAYFLVGLVPVETPANPLAFFLAGSVAIVAMILPGVSGSFILLLLGKYQQILQAVLDKDVLTLGIFAVGAVIGLSIFSRVLSWLFSKHHDIAIVMLTGFMIGSLRKVWPWKSTIQTYIDSHGEVVPLVEANILPALDATLVPALLLCTTGAGIILYLDRVHATREQTGDIEDKEFKAEHKRSVVSQKHK